jgi:serine protease Do
MKSFLKFLVFVLLLALVISLIYVWQAKQFGTPETKVEKFTPADKSQIELGSVPLLERLNQEYTHLADTVIPSVVSITTMKTVVQRQWSDPLEFFFGGGRSRGRSPTEQEVSSLGSGVIVSQEGHIVTNNHVLNGTDDIMVELNDGRQAKAKIIGTDSQLDLAVLKIDLPQLRPLPLANSDLVKVGQLVFAIGNPFGLEESVSQGIISAKDRRAISESSLEFFQTDTAINPGNSGGPLVNIKGEVVGINTAIYSESGGNQGIGFAIPANVVRRAIKNFIEKGRVIRGYLGVSVQPVTKEIAEQFKLDSNTGALVTDVTRGSPAEKAGIIRGDVIQKINNQDIKDTLSLGNQISDADIGSNLTVAISRDGKKMSVTARVAEQPAEVAAQNSQGASPTTSSSKVFAGVEVNDLNPRLRAEANVPEYVKGVIVVQVDPDASTGQDLRVGDVIEEVNRQPTPNSQAFARITGQLDPGKPVVVGLTRNRQRSFLILQPN